MKDVVIRLMSQDKAALEHVIAQLRSRNDLPFRVEWTSDEKEGQAVTAIGRFRPGAARSFAVTGPVLVADRDAIGFKRLAIEENYRNLIATGG